MSGDDDRDHDGVEIDVTSAGESSPPDAMSVDPTREIEAAMDDLEALLKNGDVVGFLTQKGVNASLALVAADALRAYLKGQKLAAAHDFADVADEIRARIAASAKDA